MNIKSKAAILVIVLLALFYTIILALPNYRNIELSFIQSAKDEYNFVIKPEQITTKIFPLPKFIVKDINLGDSINIQRMELIPSLSSIIKLNPRISKILINDKDYQAVLTQRYNKNVGSYLDSNVNIKNSSIILSHYPDLKKSLESYFGNNAFNLSCQIFPSQSEININNIKFHAKNTAISGAMNLVNNKSGFIIGFDLLADSITIKKEQVTDLKITGALINNQLSFENISGKFSSGGHFDLSGEVQKNKYRSILFGNLDFKHDDINSFLNSFGLTTQSNGKNVPLSLKANVILTPIEYSLSNIDSQIDKMKISGDAGIIFIGTEPRINVGLDLDNFSTNKYYPVISRVMNYAASLTQGMKDKDYNKKFIPISKNKQLTNFDIKLSNANIFDHKIEKLSLDGNITSGFFAIKKLIYQNQNNRFTGELSLNTHTIKPELFFSTKNGNINIENFTAQKLLDIATLINQNFDSTKASANIDINLDELTINGNNFKEAILQSSINKQTISDIHFYGKNGEKSDLDINANIHLSDPMILNAAMAYNNFDIHQITGYSPIEISASGPMSIQATLNTNGNSLEELFYKSQIEAEYVAPKLTVMNFNLDPFIKSLLSLDYQYNNFANEAKNLTKTGTTEILDLTGEAKFQKGVLSVNDITYRTNYASAALEANFNLYNQDYQAAQSVAFLTPLTLRDTEQVTLEFTANKSGQNETSDINFDQLMQILKRRQSLQDQ